ncbi:MAG: DUF1080 domain-containing protein [Pirellulaceae bacterium]
MKSSHVTQLGMFLFVLQACAVGGLGGQEWKSGVEWKEPPIVHPGKTDNLPPSDAVVLFNGEDLSQWEGGDKWLVKDGVAIPQGGEIRTKQAFGDVQLHLEWAAPLEIEGEGQGRGNSGVFLMGLYEVQVLDSYNNTTYFDGQAGAIYKQTPPMVNAMRRPGEWNTYDILFTAPRFRVNGMLSQPAYITVIHNGIVVLNHFELLGSTGFTEAPRYVPHAEKAPIALQFHNDPVQFRNIWVRELTPPVGYRAGPPYNLERSKAATGKNRRKKKEDRPAEPPPAEAAPAKPAVPAEPAPKAKPDSPKV